MLAPALALILATISQVTPIITCRAPRRCHHLSARSRFQPSRTRRLPPPPEGARRLAHAAPLGEPYVREGPAERGGLGQVCRRLLLLPARVGACARRRAGGEGLHAQDHPAVAWSPGPHSGLYLPFLLLPSPLPPPPSLPPSLSRKHTPFLVCPWETIRRHPTTLFSFPPSTLLIRTSTFHKRPRQGAG